ncbi:hypothetical protein [Spiroplasma endosymbiont of Villa modesta]|uniref:hypothetical protein n=2 Tax=Spiroplasma endosymbiont of Villa modesta TaxID=3066293 RepID=UPI00313D121A
MNNYLLSIDPSIKNTGFTLWEKQWYQNDIKSYPTYFRWKPILIKSYSFKKYSTGVEISKSDYIYNNNFNYLILNQIEKELDFQLGSKNSKSNFNLIIERGTFHSKNGIGYETQEHLRGFIAGQFNKLLTKNMLISPSEWKKWYVKNDKYCSAITFVNGINYKWDKNVSLFMCEYLIKENKWNIKISNHDEADSLLIGWYYLNKENK